MELSSYWSPDGRHGLVNGRWLVHLDAREVVESSKSLPHLGEYVSAHPYRDGYLYFHEREEPDVLSQLMMGRWEDAKPRRYVLKKAGKPFALSLPEVAGKHPISLSVAGSLDRILVETGRDTEFYLLSRKEDYLDVRQIAKPGFRIRKIVAESGLSFIAVSWVREVEPKDRLVTYYDLDGNEIQTGLTPGAQWVNVLSDGKYIFESLGVDSDDHFRWRILDQHLRVVTDSDRSTGPKIKGSVGPQDIHSVSGFPALIVRRYKHPHSWIQWNLRGEAEVKENSAYFREFPRSHTRGDPYLVWPDRSSVFSYSYLVSTIGSGAQMGLVPFLGLVDGDRAEDVRPAVVADDGSFFLDRPRPDLDHWVVRKFSRSF
jgi:hypothetical protein